ncbi:hypothetical protein K474DRAFT_136028 [Panus rudis PR-1116 ss-1]|nr:hypothetical protein K474DRAFT_136028 [Panus rudis PR-1116 ss-1]
MMGSGCGASLPLRGTTHSNYPLTPCGTRETCAEEEDDESIHSNRSVRAHRRPLTPSRQLSDQSLATRKPPPAPSFPLHSLDKSPKQERCTVGSSASSPLSSRRSDEHSSTIGDICLITALRKICSIYHAS